MPSSITTLNTQRRIPARSYFLPMFPIFSRDVATTLPLVSRLVPHFGEDGDDLMQTMFEVAPRRPVHRAALHAEILPHRFWWASAPHRRSRRLYSTAMKIGRASAHCRWAGKNDAATSVHEWRCANHRLRPRAQQARPRQAGAGHLRRRAAPAGNGGSGRSGASIVEAYGQTRNRRRLRSGQKQRFSRPGNVGTVVNG